MNRGNEALVIVGIIITIVGILTGIVLWERYKYQDCKKVGHSTVYCIFKIGK